MRGKKRMIITILAVLITLAVLVPLTLYVTNIYLGGEPLCTVMVKLSDNNVHRSSDGCEIKIVINKMISAKDEIQEPTLATTYNPDWDFRGEHTRSYEYSCEITKCLISDVLCNSPFPEANEWAKNNRNVEAQCTSVDHLGNPHSGPSSSHFKTKVDAPPLTNNYKYYPYCGGIYQVQYTCRYLGDECNHNASSPATEDDTEILETNEDDTTGSDPEIIGTNGGGAAGSDVEILETNEDDTAGSDPDIKVVDNRSRFEKFIDWLRSFF